MNEHSDWICQMADDYEFALGPDVLGRLRAAAAHIDKLETRIAALEARVPVVCPACDGSGRGAPKDAPADGGLNMCSYCWSESEQRSSGVIWKDGEG